MDIVDITEIEKLVELYKSGSITKEEFESLKSEILNVSQTQNPKSLNTFNSNIGLENKFRMTGYLNKNMSYIDAPDVDHSFLYLKDEEVKKIRTFIEKKIGDLGKENLKNNLTEDEKSFIRKYMPQNFANKTISNDRKEEASNNLKYAITFIVIILIVIAKFYTASSSDKIMSALLFPLILFLSLIAVIFGLLGYSWHGQAAKLTPDNPKYKTGRFFISWANKSTYSMIMIVATMTTVIGFVAILQVVTPSEQATNHSTYETPTTQSDNNSTTSNSDYSNSQTCDWCGKSFSGSHYTHLGKMSDCYSSTSSNSIGKYCSMRCCSEARRSSCRSCR